MKSISTLIIAVLSSVFVHAETTYYVCAETGSDGNDGLSWATATASIQKAITLSSSGDIIYVSNGVYSAISITKDNLVIESINGADSTVIDGRGSSRCVDSSTNANTIIGFTLKNGTCFGGTSGSFAGGAGARNITAIQCTFSGNIGKAHQSSGGVSYNDSCGGGAFGCILNGCLLTNNYAPSSGGGAFNCTLTTCRLENNRSGSLGAAADRSTLYSCLILGNTSGNGSGINGIYKSTVNNCTVISNSIVTSTAINSLATSNCFNSDTETISCSEVPASSFIDFSEHDFHLNSTSSAIDAGDNNYVATEFDLDGNPRISRVNVDLGCFEHPIPTPPIISANGAFWISEAFNQYTITSDNTNSIVWYAIDDELFVSAGVQSITLSTDKTIHVRAYVIAYDRFQSEIVEADIVKVEPCAVVEGVTATWNESETEVSVEWNAQAGAFTYAIYRGDTDDFDSAVQLTNGCETCRYVDAPGDPDLVYYYWAVGENELGPGQVGNAVETRWAQVATPMISPEDGTRFGTTSKKVMFSCATAGVTFHYTTDGSDPTTNSPSASAFTLRDTATVKVIAAKSRMRTSEIATATITRVYVAAAPILGGVEQVGEGLRFGWNGVEDAESYQVYRGRSPDFAAAELQGETEETEWTDGTAATGVTYYYFVLSKNIAGVSSAGAPALGATLTLATAVNASQLVFSTDAACPWVAVATGEAFDGKHQATSGTPDDSAESCLETTVTGPGQLTFRWKASCEQDDEGNCEWDHLAFRVDGADVVRLDGESGWEEVTTDITAGEHTLRWVYVKDEGLSSGDDCGRLDFVQWIPTETKGEWEKWIDYYGLFTNSGYDALKPLPSGKGDTLYEEFVAGLNPLDVLSKFRARIDASAEPPVISWNPDLGDARTYTVEGKALLTDETWTAPNTDSRFFRVWVKDGP